MVSIEIIYEGKSERFQIGRDEAFKDILVKYCSKLNKNMDEIFFFYEGKLIDENKTFNDLANSEDKQTKQMKIFVTDHNDDYQKLINEFREEYSLFRDEHSDNQLFESLILNNFDKGAAFTSLFDKKRLFL